MVTARAWWFRSRPTLVVQPLETAIVRQIDVHAGEQVQAGQVLARLDPTFATADLGALVAQVSSLQAQVVALQAESDSKPFTYTGLNPDLALQAAIFAQRQAEYNYKLRELQRRSRRTWYRRSSAPTPTRKATRTGLPWRRTSRRCDATLRSFRSAASSTRLRRWTTPPRCSATTTTRSRPLRQRARELGGHGR